MSAKCHKQTSLADTSTLWLTGEPRHATRSSPRKWAMIFRDKNESGDCYYLAPGSLETRRLIER